MPAETRCTKQWTFASPESDPAHPTPTPPQHACGSSPASSSARRTRAGIRTAHCARSVRSRAGRVEEVEVLVGLAAQSAQLWRHTIQRLFLIPRGSAHVGRRLAHEESVPVEGAVDPVEGGQTLAQRRVFPPHQRVLLLRLAQRSASHAQPPLLLLAPHNPVQLFVSPQAVARLLRSS